jgi:hypothetical protein
MMTSHYLYLAAAALMLLDALAYSFGALRQLPKALAPRDPYLSRRLLLNLMLANAGPYFTAAFVFVGAYATGPQAPTGTAVMIVAVAACLYSVVTVPWLTPGDWVHSVPRGLAALAIVIGLIL